MISEWSRRRAPALYVERLIDRPHRLILGPVPGSARRERSAQDSMPMPSSFPGRDRARNRSPARSNDEWPLRRSAPRCSIRCRDPTRKPILHIAPQRLIRCQLGWLRPFERDRRRSPHASNMTYASSLGAQKSNLLTFLESAMVRSVASAGHAASRVWLSGWPSAWYRARHVFVDATLALTMAAVAAGGDLKCQALVAHRVVDAQDVVEGRRRCPGRSGACVVIEDLLEEAR